MGFLTFSFPVSYTHLDVYKRQVKYRLNRCSDLVGYHIGDFPDTLPLYHAVAVRRLLRS